MGARPAQDRNGVQVIRRAARILEALSERPEGLSLSELAERTDLARSTVHRLITALEGERLVVAASRNARFRLGPAIFSLATAAERNVVIDFHPFMARLSRDLNETVDLAVLEFDHIRFVHQIAAMHRLRAVSSVGAVFPAYCTANGKALLARLPAHDVERLLPDRFDQLTPATITERGRLLDELERIREAGVAYDREEHTIGICAVGIAVDDAERRTVAVTVPIPASRFAQSETRIVKGLVALRRGIERSVREAASATERTDY